MCGKTRAEANARKWFLRAVVFGVMLGSAAGQDAASVHLVEQAPVAIGRIATSSSSCSLKDFRLREMPQSDP